jgi:hypothetical protein
MKTFRNILIAIPVLFVLWIVALFNDMELIPELKEDYYIDGVGLDREMVLVQAEEKLTLKMPWDSDDLRSIDLDVNPPEGRHLFTLNNMSAKVILPDGEKERKYLYFYAAPGEVPNKEVFTNYPIGLADDDSVSSYVEVRSVYDLAGIDEFKLQIEADYLYDNKHRTFSKTYDVVHTRKLRWRGIRIVGDH